MTVISADKDFEARTIVMVAEFDAPIEEVWDLWADPRKLERWWGPPTYPATFDRYELAPGGDAGYYMTSPEGDTHRGWWKFTAIDPPKSLSFVDGFADDEGNPVESMPASTVNVTFTEREGRTRMELRSTFDSVEAMEKMVEMGVVEGMSAAMGQMDSVLRGDVLVTRAFEASPEAVFAAWTEPEKFAHWFGGDSIEVPGESVDLDVKVGGQWKATMRLPDGGEINWTGEYTEVDPPRRLALTMSDEPGSPAGAPVTVDIFEAGGPTGMTVTQPRGDFTDEQVEQTTAGYHSFFDSMQRLLAS